MNAFKARKPAPTLKEQIHHQLLESITRSEFEPNEILTEKALVERYNVSKSPVREALIELCNEGVLRSIPRYGYEVVRLTNRDIQNIRDYRLIVECGCMEKCWHMITPEKVARLAQEYTREGKPGESLSLFQLWQRNTRFHLDLIDFYQNPFLAENLAKALRMNTRAYAQFYWELTHSTFMPGNDACHHSLLAALVSGDKARSLQLLENDIKEFPTDYALRR